MSIGMSGERRQHVGEVRLATIGAGNRIAIAADQLFKLGSAVFTNVFKYRHINGLRELAALCFILAQRVGWWAGPDRQEALKSGSVEEEADGIFDAV